LTSSKRHETFRQIPPEQIRAKFSIVLFFAIISL
jgi:hypothetical protein